MLNTSVQDLEQNQSPNLDKVRVEKGGLRQDFGKLNLGTPAPGRILALGEHRFVRAGFELFEKTFRLYADESGFPIIESFDPDTEDWVFEVTTDEFTVEDVLLSWKSYFNMVFFADGQKVFKWDNANLVEDEGNDFPADNAFGTYFSESVPAIVTPAGAAFDFYRVHYSLFVRGPTSTTGSVVIALLHNGVEIATKSRVVEASGSVGRELDFPHEILSINHPIADEDTLSLEIKELIDITPLTGFSTQLIREVGDMSAIATYGGGSAVDNLFKVSFQLLQTSGSGEVKVSLQVTYKPDQDNWEELAFLILDTSGRHEIQGTVDADPQGFRIVLEELDASEWTLNDPGPADTESYLIRDETLFIKGHGFNLATDEDPSAGVTYSTEGDPLNELVLVYKDPSIDLVLVGRYIGIFADRVVVMVHDGDQERIIWCARGEPDDWLGPGADEVVLPSRSNPVDELKALEPLTSNVAALYRESSIMRVVETGQVANALAFFHWIEKLGTNSPFSVIVVPGGQMFLGSDFQVYILTESGHVPVGMPIQEDFHRVILAPELVESVFDPIVMDYILAIPVEAFTGEE